MKNNKFIATVIETCDICGITWDLAYKKYHDDLKCFAGFESTKYKNIGWLDICPGCRKYRNSEIFEEIIQLKIILLLKTKEMFKLKIKPQKG